MKSIDGVEYVNATEAAKLIGGNRQSFYANVKPYLRPHHFGARKAPWYKKEEVLAIATGKIIRKGTIPITGMFQNWTEYACSLGYNAYTRDRHIQVETLPPELAMTFHLPTTDLFVKRGRMSFVDETPICSWDTYYPLKLVNEIVGEIQQGTAHHIAKYIKERHGMEIRRVKDRYSTRITTIEEMNLFHLLNEEPVLVLQRVSRTHDQQALVLFSDMVLLGNWFVIEREEELHR